MIKSLALLVLLSGPAAAEPARVYSGEHADFTRLVVELPERGAWTVGKTAMGYSFAAVAVLQPDYDISQVWDRIPKTRLQALRTDPESGALQLTLACQCHVFPFEYSPGVVVLDIKPGPAPSQSAFEMPFDPPGSVADVSQTPEVLPAVSYDWIDLKRHSDLIATTVTELPVRVDTVSLDPLRRELLEEISRAAAKGVVDMVLPGKPVDVPAVDSRELPWTQIRIGPPPEAGIPGIASDDEELLPGEGTCAPDEKIALPSWGAEKLPHDLIVEARAGLFGEFDAVDPVAVLHAVRLHLFLGFGAEATQYAGMLSGTDLPDEYPLLISMSKLVDGDPDPASPFLDMATCDGNAALWAALAHQELPQGKDVNTDAVVRAFLALPTHLRVSLGPPLAEKLLENGALEATRMVRNAVERTPYAAMATVSLLDASSELRAGRPDAALEHAKAAAAEVDAGPEELFALVEAHFQNGQPISPEIVTSLQAFQEEVGEPESKVRLQRALALAQVLSGQTDEGFSTARQHELDVSDLFQAAYQLADDDAFLRLATLSPSTQTPEVSADVELNLAKRLVTLGFSDAALSWINPVLPKDTDDRRRVAAEAELARGDARRAVTLLAGLDAPMDESLRAKALVQLGALAEARTAYLAAGLPEEAQRLVTWQGDWQGLQNEGDPLWSTAAAVVTPKPALNDGPLARGAALLEDAAAARAAVNALLAGLARPVE